MEFVVHILLLKIKSEILLPYGDQNDNLPRVILSVSEVSPLLPLDVIIQRWDINW